MCKHHFNTARTVRLKILRRYAASRVQSGIVCDKEQILQVAVSFDKQYYTIVGGPGAISCVAAIVHTCNDGNA